MNGALHDRLRVLLEEHRRTDAAAYVDDTTLAEETGESVEAVRVELEVLESEGYVSLIKTYTKWAAQLYDATH